MFIKETRRRNKPVDEDQEIPSEKWNGFHWLVVGTLWKLRLNKVDASVQGSEKKQGKTISDFKEKYTKLFLSVSEAQVYMQVPS